MNNPRLYIENNEIQKFGVRSALESWKGLIPCGNGENILDIGCGPGDATSSLVRDFFPEDARIVGCDMSKKMIQFARANYATDRISYEVMNVERPIDRPEWQKAKFDKIVSFFCLHWVFDERQAITNMNYLLKLNGYLGLKFVGYYPLQAIADFVTSDAKWKSFFEAKTFRKWRELESNDSVKQAFENTLKELGFHVIDISSYVFHSEYSTEEDFITFLASIIQREETSEATAVECAKDVMPALSKKGVIMTFDDGNIIMKNSFIEIVARKASDCS